MFHGVPDTITHTVIKSVNGGKFKEIRWFSSEDSAKQWLDVNVSSVELTNALMGRDTKVYLDPNGFTAITHEGDNLKYRIIEAD